MPGIRPQRPAPHHLPIHFTPEKKKKGDSTGTARHPQRAGRRRRPVAGEFSCLSPPPPFSQHLHIPTLSHPHPLHLRPRAHPCRSAGSRRFISAAPPPCGQLHLDAVRLPPNPLCSPT
ncbi:hypothetical protein BRADI_1g37963v3 [Brachypodium distachyon]|uniref:Uncharacterized protein n=1 Tax=Brachypodium distachyon TaxID=15368 RepID=A0A0Q3L4C1_BRADI|nr:hypothetical protein BRADI_1g37963v3 [Brachypodium distachyon]